MTTPVLLMVVTGCLWAMSGQLMVWVNQRNLSAINYYGISTFGTVLFSLLVLVRWNEVPWHDERLGVMALLLVAGGVFNSVGQLVMIRNLRQGPKAPIWALSQSSMVIPFLVGWLLYDNLFSWLDGAGILCLLIALAVLGLPSNQARLRHNPRWIVLAGVTVVSIGCSQIILAIPSQWEGFSDTSNLRIPLVCSGSFLGTAVVRLYQRKGFQREGLHFCAGFVLVASLAYYLLFLAIDQFSALNKVGLVFPIGVGVCIVAFSILAWIRDRDRFCIREGLGVLCTVTGIVLISV